MNGKRSGIPAELACGWDNPIGTDGFEFLEFATLDNDTLKAQFAALGFSPVARHRRQDITLYQQGNIRFILNGSNSGTSLEFAKAHGPSACAMAFCVHDPQSAISKLIERGAEIFRTQDSTLQLSAPAIMGIGGSVLYLVDADDPWATYADFEPLAGDWALIKQGSTGSGLTYIDHVTHNVYQGNMDKWAGFYERLFNFKEIRYFDIEGKLTGLKSRAMTSPCGKIRIPVNEPSDDKSQINEYLQDYHGEGIQHIALGTRDIYQTVDSLRGQGIEFLDVPDTYYESIDTRVPAHGEDNQALQKRRILIDGAPTQGQGLLLQIFTHNMLGPIFFEIIQRKGNEGFGEGNFQALFEAIERDQMARGVL